MIERYAIWKILNSTHHKQQFSDDIRAHKKIHCKNEDKKFVFLKREKDRFALDARFDFSSAKIIFDSVFWTWQLLQMISFISIWFSINFIFKHIFLKACEGNETVKRVLHRHLTIDINKHVPKPPPTDCEQEYYVQSLREDTNAHLSGSFV